MNLRHVYTIRPAATASRPSQSDRRLVMLANVVGTAATILLVILETIAAVVAWEAARW